nr:hypothetical protein [Tanacetum cinerariifolium]
KNLTELLASQTNEKTGLGYNSQVFTRVMFDCDDYLSSESDESWPPSSLYDRFQPSDGYHVFMPPKLDLVFNTVPTAIETNHYAFNVQLSPTKPDQDLSHTNRPTTPIIEDWVSDSEDESETKSPQIVLSFVQSTEQVKSPRHSVQHVETSIPAATTKPAIPKPTSNGKRRNRKACFVCKRYAAKIGMDTKMPNSRPCFPQNKCINDPKKGNPQHTLKDKRVIDSRCSRHMTGNISYLSDFEELNGGYVTFGGNPKGEYAFDGKEPGFDKKKPESEVNVSPSSRYRDLSVEFEDYSEDNINEVNAAGTLVSTVGQISPNSTNTFSADGPSNVVASPAHGNLHV